VTARPAHDLAEHGRQARPAARPAPVEVRRPVGSVRLTRRADQHLAPTGHRPHPRRSALLGVEGRAAAEGAPRPALRLEPLVRRPHGQQGYASWIPREPSEVPRSGGRTPLPT
jgi:hypothetical protein